MTVLASSRNPDPEARKRRKGKKKVFFGIFIPER
jgi:hypothetical protein